MERQQNKKEISWVLNNYIKKIKNRKNEEKKKTTNKPHSMIRPYKRIGTSFNSLFEMYSRKGNILLIHPLLLVKAKVLSM